MSLKIMARSVILPIGLSLGLFGCGVADVHVDAPILEAVGIDLNAKKVEEDVPERTGIVLPPSTDKLPEPSQTRTAAADSQNWPEDPEVIEKRRQEQEAAERERYCREGQWEKGNIDEFDKNVGREQRCQSSFAEAVSKALGGGPAEEEEEQD